MICTFYREFLVFSKLWEFLPSSSWRIFDVWYLKESWGLVPHVCWRRSACLDGELSRIGEAARSSSNFSLSSVSIFEVCPGPFLFLKGLFLNCTMYIQFLYEIKSWWRRRNWVEVAWIPFSFPIDLCLDLWTFMENYSATKKKGWTDVPVYFFCTEPNFFAL